MGTLPSAIETARPETAELPQHFERFCCDVVRRVLDQLRIPCSVRERQLGRGDDGIVRHQGGRDFDVLLSGSVPTSLGRVFGVLDRAGRYYFEAKFKHGGVLGVDDVAENLFGMEADSLRSGNYRGIVVMTNAAITECAYFRLTAYHREKQNLVILDGSTLTAICAQIGLCPPADFKLPQSHIKPYDEFKRRVATDRGRALEISYIFYNRSAVPQRVEITSQSQGSWLVWEVDRANAADGSERPQRNVAIQPIALGPWSSRAVRLEAVPAFEALSDDGTEAPPLRFVLSTQSADGEPVETDLVPSLPFQHGIFAPPFVGKAHEALVEDFCAKLKDFREAPHDVPRKPLVLPLLGAAGTGKSRVMAEFQSKFETDNPFRATFLTYIFKRNGGPEAKLSETSRGLSQFLKIFNFKHRKAVYEGTIIDLMKLLISSDASVIEGTATPVIVLEDVHNGDEAVLVQISELLKAEAATALAVMVVGRNDDSFLDANLAYATFRQTLPHRPFKLPDLTDEEARKLVRLIIPEILPSAERSILRLAANRPQFVVQVIHHLLDTGLVALLTNRRSVSIIDAPTFRERVETLPHKIDELMMRRFENLGAMGRVGRGAQWALVAAALHGTAPQKSVVQLVKSLRGSSGDAAAVLWELRDRGYFGADTDARDTLAWAHESIFLFFRNRLREYVRALSLGDLPHDNLVGQCLHELARDQLLKPDCPSPPPSGLWRAALQSLAGDIDDALNGFDHILSLLGVMRQYSSVELENEYYPFIEYAILCLLRRTDVDAHLVARLALGKAAMGAFRISLAEGRQSYEYGRKLAALASLAGYAGLMRFWLDQIITHQEHDSGRTALALPKLLGLRNRLDDGTAPDGLDKGERLRLAYDIHNSLRMSFHRTNFPELSASHGRIADEIALEADQLLPPGPDGSIDSGQLLHPITYGDAAFRHYYTDPQECLRQNRAGEELCRKADNKHHIVNYGASLISCQLRSHRKDKPQLRAWDAEVSGWIQDCQRTQQPPLPRLYLLRAGMSFLLGLNEEDGSTAQNDCFEAALSHADLGLDLSLELSVGYVSWQIHNLKAMIAGRTAPYTGMRKQLATALEQIDKDGLLFMGNESMTSAVPLIIANCIKKLDEVYVRSFVARIHGIHPYGWGRPEEWRKVQATAERFHHCIPSYGEVENLIVDSKTNLAFTCWL